MTGTGTPSSSSRTDRLAAIPLGLVVVTVAALGAACDDCESSSSGPQQPASSKASAARSNDGRDPNPTSTSSGRDSGRLQSKEDETTPAATTDGATDRDSSVSSDSSDSQSDDTTRTEPKTDVDEDTVAGIGTMGTSGGGKAEPAEPEDDHADWHRRRQIKKNLEIEFSVEQGGENLRKRNIGQLRAPTRALKHCYEKRLIDDMDWPKDVRLTGKLRVAPDGKYEAVEITDEDGSPALANCTSKQLENAASATDDASRGTSVEFVLRFSSGMF